MLRCLNASTSILRTIRLTTSSLSPIATSSQTYYKNYTSRRAHKYFMDLIDKSEVHEFKERKKAEKTRRKGQTGDAEPGSSSMIHNRRQLSSKLRGLPSDSEDVKMSKTLSWILRHGSQSEGLPMRPDGYVKISDLLKNPKFRSMDFQAIEKIVQADKKTRFNLLCEPESGLNMGENIWWIRANQGHSMKTVQLELHEILSVSDIPSGVAVHGTSLKAWNEIRRKGLSKMSRNHIHLAQGVPGSGVISGMRHSSQVLVYIDVEKAMQAGIKFYLSSNGVVLTPGNAKGFLNPRFFQRVEGVGRKSHPTMLDASELPESSGDERAVNEHRDELKASSSSSGPSESCPPAPPQPQARGSVKEEPPLETVPRTDESIHGSSTASTKETEKSVS